MTLRSRRPWWWFYRGVAVGLALLLCLPPPDLLAQPSAKSIFAGKQASHTAVRERNLRELDAKQGMLQQQGAGDRGRTTTDGRRATASLSLASLQDLAAISIPQEDGPQQPSRAPFRRTLASGTGCCHWLVALASLHTVFLPVLSRSSRGGR